MKKKNIFKIIIKNKFTRIHLSYHQLAGNGFHAVEKWRKLLLWCCRGSRLGRAGHNMLNLSLGGSFLYRLWWIHVEIYQELKFWIISDNTQSTKKWWILSRKHQFFWAVESYCSLYYRPQILICYCYSNCRYCFNANCRFYRRGNFCGYGT